MSRWSGKNLACLGKEYTALEGELLFAPMQLLSVLVQCTAKGERRWQNLYTSCSLLIKISVTDTCSFKWGEVRLTSACDRLEVRCIWENILQSFFTAVERVKGSAEEVSVARVSEWLCQMSSWNRSCILKLKINQKDAVKFPQTLLHHDFHTTLEVVNGFNNSFAACTASSSIAKSPVNH